MSNIACLVACSRSKRDGRNVSFGVYDSVLFEKSWGAASLVGDPFVMSAKHHLLSVNDRVDDYDETLKNYSSDEKIEWAEEVAGQLPRHYDVVVLFGGRDYVEPLKEVLDVEVVDAYEGTSGNGKQMAVAGEIVEAELNGDGYL